MGWGRGLHGTAPRLFAFVIPWAAAVLLVLPYLGAASVACEHAVAPYPLRMFARHTMLHSVVPMT